MMFGVTAMAQAPKAPEGTTTITGKLAKIDGKALTITVTVDGKAQEKVVNCTDETRIFTRIPPVAAATATTGDKEGPPRRGGYPAKLEDLKVGQQVRCNYTNDNNAARMVTIMPEPGAASSPAATTPAAK
jgi:hypothetical protein